MRLVGARGRCTSKGICRPTLVIVLWGDGKHVVAPCVDGRGELLELPSQDVANGFMAPRGVAMLSSLTARAPCEDTGSPCQESAPVDSVYILLFMRWCQLGDLTRSGTTTADGTVEGLQCLLIRRLSGHEVIYRSIPPELTASETCEG